MSVLKQRDVLANRYILSCRIGDRGYAEVWKAYDVLAGDAVVALKIYAPGKGLDSDGIGQFERAYSITYPVSHPNLLKIHYFGVEDGRAYLVMPFYNKGLLGDYLRKRVRFDAKQVAALMHQVGGALAELHDQQPPIVHGHVGPDNILLDDSGSFILTDAGIGRLREAARKAVADPHPRSVAYAPPEYFAAVPAETEAGDVFALGVVLYELCTGQLPWGGIGGVGFREGAPAPALPGRFPRPLNAMIGACLAPERQNRPTAHQVAAWGKFYLEHRYWQLSGRPSRWKPWGYRVAASLEALWAFRYRFMGRSRAPGPMD